MMRFAQACGVAALIGCVAAGGATAADYPNRTIQIVVPYAAGGGVDLTARVIAQQMSEDTGQSIVVVNKLGASGIVGSQFVSAAKPDGYTLLLASGVTEATAPALLSQSSFDLMRDLTPITEVAYGAEVLVVNAKFPVKSFAELVDYVKQHPGFRWGIGGIGMLEHLTITALDQRLAVKPVIVPYNGVAPAAVATISGEVDGTLLPLAGAQGNLHAGTLRALAVAGTSRLDQIPDVPTIASLGLPGFEAYNWQGIWGPKDMPKALASQIQAAVAKALSSPRVQAAIVKSGFAIPDAMTPEAFAAYVKAEIDKDGPLIKTLGLSGQH